MKLRNKQGQNVIEYILVSIAVIAVVFVFLSTKGRFAGAVNNTLKTPMGELNHLNAAITFNSIN